MMCRTKRNKAEELEAIIKDESRRINIRGNDIEVTTGSDKQDEHYYILIDLEKDGNCGINSETLKRKTPVEKVKNVRVSGDRMMVQVKLEE